MVVPGWQQEGTVFPLVCMGVTCTWSGQRLQMNHSVLK